MRAISPATTAQNGRTAVSKPLPPSRTAVAKSLKDDPRTTFHFDVYANQHGEREP